MGFRTYQDYVDAYREAEQRERDLQRQKDYAPLAPRTPQGTTKHSGRESENTTEEAVNGR